MRRAPGRLQAVHLRRLELRLFASVNGGGFDGFRLEIHGFIMGLMVDLITRKMVVSMDLPGLVNGGFMVILPW